MRLFARVVLSLGLGFLMIGLLRTSEDSWIYAHVSGSIISAVLATVFLTSFIMIPGGRKKP